MDIDIGLGETERKEYTELALAVDQIAERIRALGFPAPASYAEFTRLLRLSEDDGSPRADETARHLIKAQEAVVRTARSGFPAAEGPGDQATADLLTQRLQIHEKTAWMLRVMFEAP